MIVYEDLSIASKWQVSIIDDVRVIIYDHNMFIIQATDVNTKNFFFVSDKEAIQAKVFVLWKTLQLSLIF
jgi:hypothetical protein